MSLNLTASPVTVGVSAIPSRSEAAALWCERLEPLECSLIDGRCPSAANPALDQIAVVPGEVIKDLSLRLAGG